MTTTYISKPLIVVLNWNGENDTIRCIESLLRQSFPATILVVDNDSSDNSVSALVAKFKDDIILLKQPRNLGFAGGVNVGIRYAIDNGYDAVALLNNDAVADKDWLKELMHAIQPHRVGIATGLLLHQDGMTIDSTGEFYSSWGLAFPRNRGDGVNLAPGAGFVFGASGGASLIKSVVFKKIGMYDEDFFMYFEDVDLSFRAQLAGWKVTFNPKAIAYHKQGASTKKVPGLAVQKYFANLPQVFIKNVPNGLLWYIGSRLYLSYILFLLNALFHGNAIPAFKGFGENILLTPGSLIKRRNIQKHRKVSATHIKRMLWDGPTPIQTGMRKFLRFFTGKA